MQSYFKTIFYTGVKQQFNLKIKKYRNIYLFLLFFLILSHFTLG